MPFDAFDGERSVRGLDEASINNSMTDDKGSLEMATTSRVKMQVNARVSTLKTFCQRRRQHEGKGAVAVPISTSSRQMGFKP
jgi:hypothetical protein